MFTLPDLPYDYSALEPYLDAETMKVHHDGHHAAYVKNLNEALEGHGELLHMDIEELLKNLDKVPPQIQTKVKNHAGGHYHHSIFWTMLELAGSGPSGKILEAIEKKFGSFEAFKEQFNYSALGLFGSGWIWLIWENGNLNIENTPNQDSPLSRGHYPLLGIDLWEHAYYLKYKNKKAEWIEAFWNIVNWEEVGKRFEKVAIAK